MAELTPGPNPPEELYVIVHASLDSKYHYDKFEGGLMLKKVSEEPLPAAYGLIPATHHTDAEPLDAFVLVSEPPVPGSVLPARPVALVRLEAGGRTDDKILAVCSLDKEFGDITDLADVPKRMLGQLEAIFKRGNISKVSWFGADKAKKAVEMAIERHKKENE